MSKALQERRPVMIAPAASIADSLANVIASNNAYNIIRGYLDRMVRLIISDSPLLGILR